MFLPASYIVHHSFNLFFTLFFHLGSTATHVQKKRVAPPQTIQLPGQTRQSQSRRYLSCASLVTTYRFNYLNDSGFIPSVYFVRLPIETTPSVKQHLNLMLTWPNDTNSVVQCQDTCARMESSTALCKLRLTDVSMSQKVT